MAYLGQYEFLHSTDDYPKHGEDPEVVGTSTCQLILTAHQPTHMYILTVVLPKDTVKDFSTTQVLDQLSHESLWIARPKDAGQYLGINTKKYTAIPDYVVLILLHDIQKQVGRVNALALRGQSCVDAVLYQLFNTFL